MMSRRTPLCALVPVLLLALAATAAAQSPAPYDQLPADRVLYVAPGQELEELVRRAYPERAGEWERIRRWIVEHNPHAFVGGDPARLRGGVRLRLPSASAFASRQPAGDRPDFRLVFDDRFLFVNPAQSLTELVPRLYPDQRERWGEIIDAIQRRNADALDVSDARRTIARGTRLRIPDVVEQRAEADPPPPSAPAVGRIVAATGTVVAIDRDGSRRVLRSGGKVRRGDRLRTGAGATARIELGDGERLDLRPDSRVRVREWQLPETGPGRRVVELLQGGFRAVTGAIGNRDSDDYRTVTPTATLGVRGTDYALRLCPADECARAGGGTAPAGLYVGVAAGAVSLLNAAGEIRVAEGEYGFVAAPDSAPARVAAGAAPRVYRTGEPSPRAAAQPAAADEDEDGTSPWWALGLLLLLAL